MTSDNPASEKASTVCFSGHRPEKLPDGGNSSSQVIKAIKSILYKEILDSTEHGYRTFVTGLARGVDLWAGEIILELKARGMPLKLVAAFPYRGHGDNFRGTDKFILGNIVLKADEKVYVSEEYSRVCMKLRNEYMVDRSGKLIAVVSDYRSGTGQTIRYAQKQGIDVKIINSARIERELSLLAEGDKLAF